MSGRATRRRGVRPDRVKRQRAGIARLNAAFGYAGESLLPKSPGQTERRARLLASLGFGTRQRKGDTV